MAITPSTRFSSVYLNFNRGMVTYVTATESSGVKHEFIMGDLTPPNWGPASGDLKALRDIYVSSNGLRDSDGDPLVPTLYGCPFTTTVAELESLGYVNPLDDGSHDRIIRKRKTAAASANVDGILTRGHRNLVKNSEVTLAAGSSATTALIAAADIPTAGDGEYDAVVRFNVSVGGVYGDPYFVTLQELSDLAANDSFDVGRAFFIWESADQSASLRLFKKANGDLSVHSRGTSGVTVFSITADYFYYTETYPRVAHALQDIIDAGADSGYLSGVNIFGPVYMATETDTAPATPTGGTVTDTAITVAPTGWSLAELKATGEKHFVWASYCLHRSDNSFAWLHPILEAQSTALRQTMTTVASHTGQIITQGDTNLVGAVPASGGFDERFLVEARASVDGAATTKTWITRAQIDSDTHSDDESVATQRQVLSNLGIVLRLYVNASGQFRVRCVLNQNSHNYDITIKSYRIVEGMERIAEAIRKAGGFTAADEAKLDGIAAGAEVNVQSDWNATSGDSQILNKPTIPTVPDKATNSDVDGETDDAKYTTVLKGKRLIERLVPSWARQPSAPDNSQNIPDNRLLPAQGGALGQVLTETSGTAISAPGWVFPNRRLPIASGQFAVYRRESGTLANATDLASGRLQFYRSPSAGGAESSDRTVLGTWNEILGQDPSGLGTLQTDQNRFMIVHQTENRNRDLSGFYRQLGYHYWTYPLQFLVFADHDQWVLFSGNLIGNSAAVGASHMNFRLERVLAFNLTTAQRQGGIPFDLQIKWGFQSDNDTVLAQKVPHVRFRLAGANQPTLPTLSGWDGSAFATGNANQTTEAPPAQDESTSTHLWIFHATSTRTAGRDGTWSTTAWTARRATDPDSTTFSVQYSPTGTGSWFNEKSSVGSTGYIRFRQDGGEWFGPVYYGALPNPPTIQVEYSATETGTYTSTVRSDGFFRWKLSTETTWAGPFPIAGQNAVTIPTLEVQYSATEDGTFTSTVRTEGFFRFRYNNGPWIGPSELGATDVSVPAPASPAWRQMFAYYMPATSAIVHNLVGIGSLDDYDEIEFRTQRTGADGAVGTHRMRIDEIPVTNWTPTNLTPTGNPVKLTHTRDGLQVSVGSEETESGGQNGRSVGLLYFQRANGVTSGRTAARVWHRGLQISASGELHTTAYIR